MPSDILSIARQYRKAGFNVVAIAPDGTKRPGYFDTNTQKYRSAKWTQWQNSRQTDSDIRRMFSTGHPWGIGLIQGGISGNAEVMDFDDPTIFDRYHERCVNAGLGPLVDRLPHVRTPSGGSHLYYRLESPPPGNLHLAMHPVASEDATLGVKMKTLIETRGEGGLTVAPGSSPQTHPSGNLYDLVYGSFEEIPVLSMEERRQLHEVAQSFHVSIDRKQHEALENQKSQHSPSPKGGNEVRPGDDYNRRVSSQEVFDLLSRHGWQLHSTGPGNMLLLTRPGKDTSEGCSATLNHCGDGVLFVFSTSVYPFQAGHAHTPFTIYALLEHNGDFSRAASALSTQGYGERVPPTLAPVDINVPQERTEQPHPLKLQEEALYGLPGKIVRAIDPHTESDPAAILTQLLVGFGNMVGRQPYYLVESDKHYPNLFIALVGKSGKARKGTSWGNICKLLEDVDKSWQANCVKSGLSSGEGLVSFVRDDGNEEASEKRLLTVEPEFATVLRVMEREGNTISARLRDAWDGRKIAIMTRNNPITASNAHISLIGHITEEELLRYLNRTETANGFANRILWVSVTRSKLLPEGGDFIDDPQRPELIKALAQVVSFARLQGRIMFTEDARAIWYEKYPKLTQGIPGMWGAVTSRADPQTIRIALIYALMDQSSVITASHLRAALGLWEYCFESARRIFQNSLGDPIADAILVNLQKAKDTGLCRTEISNLFKRNVSAQQITRALMLLQECSLAFCQKESSGGRDAERWYLSSSQLRANEKNELSSEATNDNSLNSYLRKPEQSVPPSELPKFWSPAMKYLQAMLADCPVAVSSVLHLATNEKLNESDVFLAKSALGVKEFTDHTGVLVWQLPDSGKDDGKGVSL